MNRVVRERIGQMLEAEIEDVVPVSGGDINRAFRVSTATVDFFVKTNTTQFPQMFSKELAGLDRLRATNTLEVPTSKLCGEADGNQFLVLTWIESARSAPDYWERLGQGLACLHRTVEDQYGLSQDNYIGSLQQRNTWMASWPEFFGQRRLLPQLQMGLRSGALPSSLLRQAEKLIAKLTGLLPECPESSLLHGDLWSGNVMTGASGEPVVIDPAVYFGHREVELAFTHLFGGFPQTFYAAYDSVWATEAGFTERRDLYNLYPLLVHANLFGGHYVTRVTSVIRRFV